MSSKNNGTTNGTSASPPTTAETCPFVHPTKQNILDVMPYYEFPDQPSKCTWKRDSVKTGQTNIHTKRTFNATRPRIIANILDVIGSTPMIKLNKIPQSFGIKCEMCKYLNLPLLSIQISLILNFFLFSKKKQTQNVNS